MMLYNIDVICAYVFFCIVDWIIVDMLLARQGGIGRVRYILKEGLKYIPLYGYYFMKYVVCMYLVGINIKNACTFSSMAAFM